MDVSVTVWEVSSKDSPMDFAQLVEALVCHKRLTVLLDTMEVSNLARRIRSVCSFKCFQSYSFAFFSQKRTGNLSTCHFMAQEGPDQLISIQTNLIWVSLFLQSIIRQNGMQIQISHSGKVFLTLNWQLSSIAYQMIPPYESFNMIIIINNHSIIGLHFK